MEIGAEENVEEVEIVEMGAPKENGEVEEEEMSEEIVEEAGGGGRECGGGGDWKVEERRLEVEEAEVEDGR